MNDNKKTIWVTAVIVLGVVVVVGLIVGAVLYGTQTNGDRGHAERMACIEGGGTVIEVLGGGTLCIRLEGSLE